MLTVHLLISAFQFFIRHNYTKSDIPTYRYSATGIYNMLCFQMFHVKHLERRIAGIVSRETCNVYFS